MSQNAKSQVEHARGFSVNCLFDRHTPDEDVVREDGHRRRSHCVYCGRSIILTGPST